MTANLPELLTREEAAAACGYKCPDAFVRALVRTRRIPYRRIGRGKFFKEAVMAERKTPTFLRRL